MNDHPLAGGPAGSSSTRHRPRAFRAYRPLQVRTLLPQLLVLVAGETLLFASYAAVDARAHWSAHLLVGLVAALVWLSAYLLILARPAPGQLLAILWGHLLVIASELLSLVGVMSQGRLRDLPGGVGPWLVSAVPALAGYALLLTCWLRARGVEAGRGMCPGVGIGGMAVVRAQRDPAVGRLAHRHRGPRAGGPLVVLLHGLGGTGAVWTQVATRLDEAGVGTLSVDLLGHGESLSLGTRFTLTDQVHAVVDLLSRHRLGPVVVVGHSWGAAVAVALARRQPGRVEQLLLITPPAFADPGLARRRLGARSWIDRRTVAGKPVSRVACGTMCLTRRVLGRLAVLTHRGVAPEVARGTVAHTYPAFRDGLDALLAPDNILVPGLRRPTHPTSVLLGERDDRVHPADIAALGPAPDVDITLIPGGHQLPITAPQPVAGFVLARLSRPDQDR